MEDRHAILLAAALLLRTETSGVSGAWRPDQMGDFLSSTVKVAEALLATIALHRTGEEH